MFKIIQKLFIGFLSASTIGELLAFNSKGPIKCISLNN